MSDENTFKVDRRQANLNFSWALANIVRAECEVAWRPFTALGDSKEVGRGSALIMAERVKQVYEDGRTPAYDSVNNPNEELLRAAIYLACGANALGTKNASDVLVVGGPDMEFKHPWMGLDEWDKRKRGQPAARLMLQAAALLAAELDRLLAEGQAFVCDRCANIWDIPGPMEVVTGGPAMRPGQRLLCAACAELQLAEDRK